MSYPDRQTAEHELLLGGRLNPGKWIEHSQNAALVCERIACMAEMDADKAYVLGLLHDIGRRIGFCGEKHTYAGYEYALSKGWDDVARVSLTHSHLFKDAALGVSEYDGTAEEWAFIKDYIAKIELNDYDLLVQLGDALGAAAGICIMEKRFVDVALRYGFFPGMLEKWRRFFEIKEYFDKKCGCSIYSLLPEVKDNLG